MKMGIVVTLVLAGLICLVFYLVRKSRIKLESGEMALFTGTANAGEGGIIKGELFKNKAVVSIVVTNKKIHLASAAIADKEMVIEYPSISNIELIEPLSARINLISNESIRLQFGIGRRGKFVESLARNNVKVS
jgi:hypothetical protein